MAWAKLDDQMHRRRKVRGLSDPAWRLYVSAIIDCCAEGSDGVLEGWALRELLPSHHEEHVRELLARGLIHDAPTCTSDTCLSSHGLPLVGTDLFVVHDFGQWQMTREEWDANKAKKQKGAHARWHKDEKKEGCRFCYPLDAGAHAGAYPDAMLTRPDLTRPDLNPSIPHLRDVSKEVSEVVTDRAIAGEIKADGFEGESA
jgi:hypothetical protein